MNDENPPVPKPDDIDSVLAGCVNYNFAMIPLFANAIADDMPEHLREMRINALKALRKSLYHYECMGYMQRLLCGIALKKGSMILKTKSYAEMQRILNPRAPYFDGNKFVPDRFSVPEEEMIHWCETSLKAPLMEEACRRYMELFHQVLPEEFSQIFGKEYPA